jgi:hypothetical protein
MGPAPLGPHQIPQMQDNIPGPYCVFPSLEHYLVMISRALAHPDRVESAQNGYLRSPKSQVLSVDSPLLIPFL